LCGEEVTIREFFGVTEQSTADEMRAAYRHKLMYAHPDYGGSEPALAEVLARRQEFFQLISLRRRCPKCQDTGIVEELVNFRVFKKTCDLCKTPLTND
jgi:DnaJ-class molecular chaperone